MKFFIDNNLSRGLAKGMECFGENVEHITEYYSGDTPDEEILKSLGEQGYYFITRDRRIRYKPSEKKAIKKYGVGAFFLLGKNMGRWDIVKQLIRSWEQVIEKSEKTRRPFAYKISRAGGKLTEVNID